MERNSKQRQFTKHIIQLRNAIKRKYKLFKEGALESDIMLEKQYKPIIQELRKTGTAAIPDIKNEPEETIKEEPMEYDTTDGESDEGEPEFNPLSKSTPSRGLSPKTKDLSLLVSTPETQSSTTQHVEEYFSNPVTRDYINMFLKDSSGKKMIDYVYGPRYEGETLMVGNAKLDFDHKGNIIIGGVNYGASEGLYELIFKKVPDGRTYNENDLKTYKSILFATNAHREGYEPGGKVKSSRSTKYMTIIRELFPPVVKGKGMAWKSSNFRNIIHWDDVNELVERLRHIAMSTETGNRVHVNEILSIVEELRESGYIKGAGNSRFKSLLT